MTKKMQQNIMLLVLVTGGLSYAYYTFLWAPMQTKYAVSVETLKATESKVAEMRRRALELPKLQAEMKQLEQQVAELERLLPKDKEIPQLLRVVTKTAQRFQIKITQINPLAVAAQPNYNELPFQMSVQGNYHAFGYFLAELGQGSRIMSARNIVYSQIPSSKDSNATIAASFTLVAYTFKG